MVERGAVGGALTEGPLLEPAVLKRRVFEAATDLAVQLVRIDDVVPATALDADERDEREETVPE